MNRPLRPLEKFMVGPLRPLAKYGGTFKAPRRPLQGPSPFSRPRGLQGPSHFMMVKKAIKGVNVFSKTSFVSH